MDNISTTTRTILMSVAGGTASVLGGGKFANGALSSAFIFMFNEMADEERQAYIKNIVKEILGDVSIPEKYKNALLSAKIIYTNKMVFKTKSGTNLTFGVTSVDFKTIKITAYNWIYWNKQLTLGKINQKVYTLSLHMQIKHTLLHEARHVFLQDNSHNNHNDFGNISNLDAFNIQVTNETGY